VVDQLKEVGWAFFLTFLYLDAVKPLFTGCSKRFRYKAPKIPRNEAYIEVRRNDEE
jgi:hypothetical protein